jgi:hypothetical protein
MELFAVFGCGIKVAQSITASQPLGNPETKFNNGKNNATKTTKPLTLTIGCFVHSFN